jgi:NADH-quinone oxidoreductase subunit F
METIAKFIAGKSFCPFGDAAVWGLQSGLAKFRNEFISHIEETNPSELGPVIPIRPIYRRNTPAHVFAPTSWRG